MVWFNSALINPSSRIALFQLCTFVFLIFPLPFLSFYLGFQPHHLRVQPGIESFNLSRSYLDLTLSFLFLLRRSTPEEQFLGCLHLFYMLPVFIMVIPVLLTAFISQLTTFPAAKIVVIICEVDNPTPAHAISCCLRWTDKPPTLPTEVTKG